MYISAPNFTHQTSPANIVTEAKRLRSQTIHGMLIAVAKQLAHTAASTEQSIRFYLVIAKYKYLGQA